MKLDWTFKNIDHAAYTRLNGGRLEPCPKCVQAVIAALQGVSANTKE